MARHSDDPVRHIVTFRVNSEEKKALEILAKNSGNSVSKYLREKIQDIKDNESSNNSSYERVGAPEC